MCRLTLVWTLAKLPQSYWNADSSWLDLLSLVWTLFHADSSPFCPVSTASLRRPSPTANFELQSSLRSSFKEESSDALRSCSMYGTRPWCLVQAITRHTCPDPHLGSWNCLPHQAHIVPSEPMSSINQQGSCLDSFPTFLPPYPHFNRPSGFWPCVKSCLVGGSDKYSLLASPYHFRSRWDL